MRGDAADPDPKTSEEARRHGRRGDAGGPPGTEVPGRRGPEDASGCSNAPARGSAEGG